MASATTPGAAASSQTTLANVERPSTSETPASGLSPPEHTKQDAYLSGASTHAPSISGDGNEKKGAETGSSLAEEPLDSDAALYPTGWTLGMVIVALVLSIFLVSLDMVCSQTSLPAEYALINLLSRLL